MCDSPPLSDSGEGEFLRRCGRGVVGFVLRGGFVAERLMDPLSIVKGFDVLEHAQPRRGRLRTDRRGVPIKLSKNFLATERPCPFHASGESVAGFVGCYQARMTSGLGSCSKIVPTSFQAT